jgi:HD superfamily phosphodiesterase
MPTKLKQQICDAILRILSQSQVPEDAAHAQNVWAWVLRLHPGAGFALQIAALGHDIERALPERKVLRAGFSEYDAFKQAHAENSAEILRELLSKFALDTETVARVVFLVRHHEFGHANDAEVEILKDADSLSFFETNLALYYQREGPEETLFRMRWGYMRLSARAKPFLRRMHYRDEILNSLLQTVIAEKA